MGTCWCESLDKELTFDLSQPLEKSDFPLSQPPQRRDVCPQNPDLFWSHTDEAHSSESPLPGQLSHPRWPWERPSIRVGGTQLEAPTGLGCLWGELHRTFR